MLKERTERKLEASGRITPREVLKAYEETGLEPMFDEFRFEDGACAIGALMERDGISLIGLAMGEEDYAVHEWAEARLGNLAFDYTWGLTNGFDGLPKPRAIERHLGWLDGHRARRIVLARHPDAG